MLERTLKASAQKEGRDDRRRDLECGAMMGRRSSLVAMALALSACTSSEMSSESVQLRRIATTDLVWTTRGIYVTEDSTSLVSGGRTLALVELTGRAHEVALDESPDGCQQIDHFRLDSTGDQVLFTRTCGRPDPSSEVSLLMLDEPAATIQPIMSLPFSPASISVAPDLGRVLVSNSQGICSGFTLVTAEGIQELAAWVGEGARRFRVDADVRRAKPGCRDVGLADLPTWSPDGIEVAFLASPESVGVAGFEKAESSWNLYLLDPETLSVSHPLLRQIGFPRDLEWSPDGSTLALSARVAGDDGLWLFRPADRSLQRVGDSVVDHVAWSPDGERIAVALPTGEPGEQRLIIHDVRDLVASG